MHEWIFCDSSFRIMSGLGSQNETDSFLPEYDQLERKCRVSIYLTPVARATSFAKFKDSAKHWALIFDFGNRQILYEMSNPAQTVKGGPIKPSWRHFSDDNQSFFSKTSQLGKSVLNQRSEWLISWLCRFFLINGSERKECCL